MYEEITKIREKEAKGVKPTWTEIAHFNDAVAFCMNMEDADKWEVHNMKYQAEVFAMPTTNYKSTPVNATPSKTLTHEQLEQWVGSMYSKGHKGAYLTPQQTTEVAGKVGVMLNGQIDQWDWWATLNSMKHDYEDLAEMFNVDVANFYGQMAKSFLFDMDTKSPKENIFYKWCSRKI